MRYVIIRDDDTNALTPVECLERLYRPFLERGLPVNLAVIPAVTTDARMANGEPEGFLLNKNGEQRPTLPIGTNQQLIDYLRSNEGFQIVQHGCHHDYLEFDNPRREDLVQRLEQGTKLLVEAGLPRPRTFVAPYDRFSRTALDEVAQRFSIVSTGWFELRRLPVMWWPRYALKKLLHSPHWQIRKTLLLSHPGCLLSCHRNLSTMLGGILHYLETQKLTVLVTHWWEYFRDHQPDEPFISFLHETAHYLANHPDIKVISFADLLNKDIALN